ncbi:small acid-soluble spore protein Tlp [Pontibacillus litoralis]
MNQQQANPDDRSDNVSKLTEAVQNTIDNMEAAHDSMRFASEEEKVNIQAKNERREQSLEAMRQEIRDEAAFQERQSE